MNAPRTARDRARAELTAAILANARQQLGEVGPADLSLRAVARELGMASSAVYRYFPSRDALLTALLVACYDEVGAAVEAADAGVPRTRYRRRWRAMAGAFRDWAAAHPHEYALLYGSPVIGYAAPEDTVAPAMRTPFALMGLIEEAEAAGVTGTTGPAVPRAERKALAPIHAAREGRLSDAQTARGLMAWATLIGSVTLELFGHLKGGIDDVDVHHAHLMERVATDLGLP